MTDKEKGELKQLYKDLGIKTKEEIQKEKQARRKELENKKTLTTKEQNELKGLYKDLSIAPKAERNFNNTSRLSGYKEIPKTAAEVQTTPYPYILMAVIGGMYLVIRKRK